MTEHNAQKYIQGQAALASQILGVIRPYLPESDKDKADLLRERVEAVAALRELCGRVGDNEWPDNLHLADVIEKHLARHL